jgi:hypothetical protein
MSVHNPEIFAIGHDIVIVLEGVSITVVDDCFRDAEPPLNMPRVNRSRASAWLRLWPRTGPAPKRGASEARDENTREARQQWWLASVAGRLRI